MDMVYDFDEVSELVDKLVQKLQRLSRDVQGTEHEQAVNDVHRCALELSLTFNRNHGTTSDDVSGDKGSSTAAQRMVVSSAGGRSGKAALTSGAATCEQEAENSDVDGPRCGVCLCFEGEDMRKMPCCEMHVHAACFTTLLCKRLYEDNGSDDETSGERVPAECLGCRTRLKRTSVRVLRSVRARDAARMLRA